MILGYDSHGAEIVEQTKNTERSTILYQVLLLLSIDEFSYCINTNKMVRGNILDIRINGALIQKN